MASARLIICVLEMPVRAARSVYAMVCVYQACTLCRMLCQRFARLWLRESCEPCDRNELARSVPNVIVYVNRLYDII